VTGNTVTGNAYTGANLASSAGILVVGGEYFGTGLADTVGLTITKNTLTGNDVGVFIFNGDAACDASPTATNNAVKLNTVSNDAVTNTTGYSATCGYQAGISDNGKKDLIVNNKVSGVGYTPVTGDCRSFASSTCRQRLAATEQQVTPLSIVRHDGRTVRRRQMRAAQGGGGGYPLSSFLYLPVPPPHLKEGTVDPRSLRVKSRRRHSSGSVGCAVSSDVRRSTSSSSASAVCNRAPSTSWPHVKVWTWRLSGCCSPKSIVINVPLPQIGQMVDSGSPIGTRYTEADTMGAWLRTRSTDAP
jgi:hypothetical protein